MENKIIFLGTAGDSLVASKQLRASGGIMLVIGESQFHIDPGPGALVAAAKNQINLRANTAVLVSNNDLLNCNDVNAVIDAMTYGGTDRNGVLVANNTLVNGTEESKPFLTKLHQSFVERIIVLNKGQKLAIEDIEIHALPTIHPDPNAVGFKFLAPEFTLVYSSDTGYSKELVKEYMGADILILNVSEPGSEKAEYWLNSDTATRIIQEVNPKLAIITHFGIKMLKSDPLYEGREMQKKTNIQVIAAKDGMGIVPGSYAARSKQKRLGGFKKSGTGGLKIEEIREEPKQESNLGDLGQEPAEEESEKPKNEHQKHLDF